MPQRALQWLSLVGAIWLQSIIGTNSNFPAYSSQFKHILSISQLQLNNLAFASDAGKLLGWFSGIAAVHLPLWLVLAVGSSLGLIGYGVQYLSLTGQIPTLSYPVVFFLTAVAGNSICWINTVSYIVSIRNFPLNHRQVAVGITTSYQGLSAKIYADVVNAVFSPPSPNKTAKAYLLMNSVLPLAVCFLSAPLVSNRDIDGTTTQGQSRNNNNNNNNNNNVDGRGFVVMFVITVATGIYSVVTSLGSVSNGMSSVHNLIGTGVLLLIPLAIPLVAKFREKIPGKLSINRDNRVCDFTTEPENGDDDHDHDDDVEEIERSTSSIEEGRKEEEEEEEEEVDCDCDGVREEIGAVSMLKRVDFWLYFFVYFCGVTIGLVFLNNLGQIAESRGSSRTSSLVSLSSSFGFFGRLLPSLLDYYLSR